MGAGARAAIACLGRRSTCPEWLVSPLVTPVRGFMASPPRDMSVCLFGYMAELGPRLDKRFASVITPSPPRPRRHCIPSEAGNRVRDVAVKLKTGGETQCGT